MTDSTTANYVIAVLGASWPWIAANWVTRLVSRHGGPYGRVVFVTAALYVVAVPLLAGVGLPRFGVDWDPEGYTSETWTLLVATGAWFTVAFAVPVIVFNAILGLASP